ncbi:MAG TPA: sugar-binding protein [Fimbriimonadaceae bacterium]|jgi:ribose transport system substrate-binding protein
MTTKTIKSISLALVLVALCGCSSKDSTSTSNSTSSGTTDKSGATAKHLKLAFVTNNASDYWTIARKGVEAAQKEMPNVDVAFRMPADGSPAAQQQIVDDELAKGVDGMAISPTDPKNQTDMINKAAGQVFVITQDSDAPNTNRACYVGSDNEAAGKQLGEELKKALPNGGNVMAFVGESDAQNAHDRIQGVKDAIAGTKIVIEDVRLDHADHTKAKSNVADVLVKEPNIAGLIGIWSYNGPAIYSAVQDAGKVGKVQILCFDEEDDTLAGVKAGAIYATVVQQPYVFGHDSVKMMNAYLNGDKSAVPANKLDYIPTLVLHKADIDAYKDKLNKLRGKS